MSINVEILYSLIAVVSFTALPYVIAFLLAKKKRFQSIEIDVEGGAILVKTTKLNEFIENFGKRHARLFKVLGNIAILSSIPMAAYGIYFFHMNLQLWKVAPSTASPVAPILPGITVGLDELPYFLLAIAITLIPHELAHAFHASSEDIKVKSAGVFLFFILPGGFAEIDEEELAKKPLGTQLRVFAAGSFANILTFLVLLGVFSLLFASPLAPKPAGVLISDTLKDPRYPAYGHLMPGDIIIAINNMPTTTLDDFSRILGNFKPNETIHLTIIRNGRLLNLTLTLAESPYNRSRGFLGVTIQQAYTNEWMYKSSWWLLVVTSSVAIINVMPIFPLDGGRMLMAALEKVLPKNTARNISLALSIYLAGILVANILYSAGYWLPFRP
jgi:membrane-associated protease RseP (regulator of RpoE activity)